MILPIAWIAAHAIGLLAVLGAHEIGHLVVGLAHGHRCTAFYLGPIAVERGERMRLRLRLHGRVGLYGGAVQLEPTRLERLSRQLGQVAAAGPIASLLVASGLWWGGQTIDGLWSSLLENLGIVSALVGVASGLPHGSDARPSDGRRVWMACRGGQSAARLVAHQIAVTLLARGDVPTKWPADWVEALQSASRVCSAGERSVFVAHAEFLAACVRNDRELARARLEEAAASCRGKPRSICAEVLACRSLLQRSVGADDEATASLREASAVWRAVHGDRSPPSDSVLAAARIGAGSHGDALPPGLGGFVLAWFRPAIRVRGRFPVDDRRGSG